MQQKIVTMIPKRGLFRQTASISAKAEGFQGAACHEATRNLYGRLGGSMETTPTHEIEEPQPELEPENEPGI